MTQTPNSRRTIRRRWIVLWGAIVCGSLQLGPPVDLFAARTFRLPFSTASQTPHPAVARINVAEKGATSHGTGTLVNVAGRHGLVVTNWHVVRDAAGQIIVEFPDGFRSAARVLKVDHDWDLAALQIWRPPVAPMAVAGTPPRPGDTLAIAGYGSGQYRNVSGRCTQYVAPGANLPYEMVELAAEARQGDSGGPILNDRGELAGVLFGASRGTTSGSYCGRVSAFLATVLTQPESAANLVAAAEPPRGTRTVIEGGAAASPTPSYPTRSTPVFPDLQAMPPSPPRVEDGSEVATDEPYFGASPRMTPTTDLSPPREPNSHPGRGRRAGNPLFEDNWRNRAASQPLNSASTSPAQPSWESLIGQTPFEQGKSILAGIGILAVLLRLSNMLAGRGD